MEETFDIKYDRGNKHTKNSVNCDMCSKPIPANKGAWEVTKYNDDRGFINNWYGCTKECANMLILKEL